ncbi:hypothetical protein [Gordonia polyisoprenivorans]|uniref:hypothetical protein n=1 Tax=Gordonia polyisoprenivorans TaxID=84595 RepID=UPI001AD78012|nr:hypothetical protein [Gordonia polyisoprenivorans]QTI69875.1 hypothetical protein J6U32_04575 [Gordonia polyisoprenivorans]
MSAVDTFWHSGRLPLSLLFLAFLLTFVITRTITRLIRAGRGPFHNNVRGGVHIHHAVPGLVLLLVGAVMSVTVAGHRPGALIAAVLIGVGASLVLDEFALILHLGDVYWSTEGQLSVQVVSLTTAVLGLLALGVNPFDDTTAADNAQLHGNWGVLVVLPIHIVCVLVCVEKGKYSTAAVGAFIPPVGWIGAIRLARPHSRWAGRHYSPAKKARAATRAAGFDDRFGKWGLTIEDWVAGKPSSGPPPAAGPTM